ncbi:cAMP-binding protein [Halobacteroides halobius DSM 5150]|uniref:cAMP-binding protein n=1 Tax=Halobacteroides halobius (strain ATCC 35273 / DSM 5150 / MD-1) TaxID=748449 RepID=L0K9Z7_HALHC|nr:Crp/Fnr family transcriptional regulator [Halobacteroides halobius]AGB41199.1 cAMP-binding protein [Halobacteroides halobius DSM 5150]
MKINDKARLLKLPLFKGLDDKIIERLNEQVLIKNYCKDEILFFDGEEVEYCYIIVSGKVKISKFTPNGQEKIIHILKAGEMINEIDLDKRSSSVTAEVIETGEIISIKIYKLLKIMKDSFELTTRIFASNSLKLRKTYRQIRNLGLKNSGPRIASRLWKLARDYGKDSKQGIKIDLNLTQRELALMIGISRETVSRFLSKLDTEGVIVCGKSKIIIKDLKELRARA